MFQAKPPNSAGEPCLQSVTSPSPFPSRRPLITTANPPSSTSFILLAIQSPQPAIKTRQRTIPLIVSLLLLLDPTNGANVHERLPRPDIHYSRFGLVRKGRRRCDWRMRWQSDGEGALLDCARYEFHFQ